MRMRRLVTVVVLAGTLGACSASGSHPSAAAPTDPTATRPGATDPAPPRFDVVLDDHGLRFPPGPTLAGRYRISFDDRRSVRPPAERLHLDFRPSGPYVILIDVAAGATTDHVLLQNMDAFVIDFARTSNPASPMNALGQPSDAIRNFPVTNPLSIVATPQYPTPVT
jgi:hypothetical protein